MKKYDIYYVWTVFYKESDEQKNCQKLFQYFQWFIKITNKVFCMVYHKRHFHLFLTFLHCGTYTRLFLVDDTAWRDIELEHKSIFRKIFLRLIMQKRNAFEYIIRLFSNVSRQLWKDIKINFLLELILIKWIIIYNEVLAPQWSKKWILVTLFPWHELSSRLNNDVILI